MSHLIFRSDFYLKSLDKTIKSGLATWYPSTDQLVHDLIDGLRDKHILYSRKKDDGTYQDYKIIKEDDKLFLTGYEKENKLYSVIKVNSYNKYEDEHYTLEKCSKCFINEKSHLAIPCGHFVTCSACSKIDRCTECYIKCETVRVFVN